MAGCCCFIFAIRQNNILLLIYADKLVYITEPAPSSLVLLYCYSDTDLVSQKPSSFFKSTLLNLTARPVLILSQIMPIHFTSVIGKPITSQIKRELPSSNPGYDYGIYPCKLFLQYRED